MATLPPESTPPRFGTSLSAWYTLFALTGLGVLLYFVLGAKTPILFDVLTAGVAA